MNVLVHAYVVCMSVLPVESVGVDQRALKCVLAGHDRSVGDNPQSGPRGPPWMTSDLN